VTDQIHVWPAAAKEPSAAELDTALATMKTIVGAVRGSNDAEAHRSALNLISRAITSVFHGPLQ
jgi:hypothetical protein